MAGQHPDADGVPKDGKRHGTLASHLNATDTESPSAMPLFLSPGDATSGQTFASSSRQELPSRRQLRFARRLAQRRALAARSCVQARVDETPHGQPLGVKPPGPDESVRPDGNTVAVVLPNDERAPGQARRAVRVAFTTWRLGKIVDDAAVAVSELVTNAVRNGLPPVGVLLRRRTGLVRIDVEDARAELPAAARETDGLPESGRGLNIVRAVADDLGSEHIPGGGKLVYASWNLTDSLAKTHPDRVAVEPPSSPSD
jgi:anti-sigma regulatory factor (Ser/Thr protein kinase)